MFLNNQNKNFSFSHQVNNQMIQIEEDTSKYSEVIFFFKIYLPNKMVQKIIQFKQKYQKYISSIRQQDSIFLNIKEKNEIGSQGSQKIGQILKSFVNCKNLSIVIQKKNKIGNQGLSYLMEGIINLKNLKQLELKICNQNNLSDEGSQRLFNNLKQLDNLEYLIIKIYDNPIGNNGILGLVKCFQYLNNVNCLTLELVNINIDSNCLMNIGKYIKYLNNLITLNITIKMQFDKDNLGIIGLFNGIVQLSNLTQFYLVLSLQLGSKTIEIICNRIQHLKNLTKLSLKFSRQSSILQGIESIGNSIKHFSQLTELKIKIPSPNDMNLMNSFQLLYGIKYCKNINKLHLLIDSPFNFIFIGLLNDLKQINNKGSFLLFKEVQVYFNRKVSSQLIKVFYIENKKNQQLKQICDFQGFIEGYKLLNQETPINFDSSFKNLFGVSNAAKKLSECFINLGNLTKFVFDLNECTRQEIYCFFDELKNLTNLQKFKLIIDSDAQIGINELAQMYYSLQQLKHLKYISLNSYYNNLYLEKDDIFLVQNNTQKQEINNHKIRQNLNTMQADKNKQLNDNIKVDRAIQKEILFKDHIKTDQNKQEYKNVIYNRNIYNVRNTEDGSDIVKMEDKKGKDFEMYMLDRKYTKITRIKDKFDNQQADGNEYQEDVQNMEDENQNQNEIYHLEDISQKLKNNINQLNYITNLKIFYKNKNESWSLQNILMYWIKTLVQLKKLSIAIYPGVSDVKFFENISRYLVNLEHLKIHSVDYVHLLFNSIDMNSINVFSKLQKLELEIEYTKIKSEYITIIGKGIKQIKDLKIFNIKIITKRLYEVTTQQVILSSLCDLKQILSFKLSLYVINFPIRHETGFDVVVFNSQNSQFIQYEIKNKIQFFKMQKNVLRKCIRLVKRQIKE